MILEFLKENYQLVALIGSFFVDLVLAIICIVLKNRKDDPVLSIISDMLPGFIKEAENQIGAGHGSEKLTFVLKKVEQTYKKLTGVGLSLTGYLYRFFVNRIENILSTPSKKGKNDEK